MKWQLFAASALTLIGAHTQAASFIPLGDLPGGEFKSWAGGVSADGGVVVGSGTTSSGLEAFRWTRATGMVGLPPIPSADHYTQAIDVSLDGTAVGLISGATYSLAPVLWNPAGELTIIGPADRPSDAAATAITPDSAVVVGKSSSGHAFRWTLADGMVGLNNPTEELVRSVAWGVSDDGKVVVGGIGSVTSEEAYRWTAETGMVGLGTLGPYSTSVAYAISGNGEVIVGASGVAFRWENGLMTSLGYLPGSGGHGSVAQGVSSDGAVIVGTAFRGNQIDAILWTPSNGMQLLLDVLVANGAPGLTGWTLTSAYAVSSDGRWVVGQGVNPLGDSEAYIADLTPVPAPAVGWLLVPAFAGLGMWKRSSGAIRS